MNANTNKPRNRRRVGPFGEGGFVLIISLLTLALMSSLGLAALYQANSEVTVVGNERVGNELLLAADSGVEYGKNAIWQASGFGTNTTVSFTNLDAYMVANPLPLTIGPMSMGSDLYYDVTVPTSVTIPESASPVSGYDDSDMSKRVITFQARAWHDSNGNGIYDSGEKSRIVTARVAFEYGSLSFPYGVLTQNTECIFCHAKIVGDVVSLNSMTIRKTNEAYSTVLGKVYTMGTTNLTDPDSRVVGDYVDVDGNPNTVENSGEVALDITTNYADPDRFPVDSNGNPAFPSIENLDYYKGLAAAYDSGTGSSLSGGAIQTVPTGTNYPTGASVVANVDESYSGNLILTGTPGNCIQLNGPVVVEGDLIIRGCVEGEGSIYTGGNVYVPDSVTYANPGTDKLAFAAGGNIVIGDYRDTSSLRGSADVGGGAFIEKQLWEFNRQVQATYPAGERRYYASSDGSIYTGGRSAVTPAAGDKVVTYLPTKNGASSAPWITNATYLSDFVNQVTGVSEVDALAYTGNAILGQNKSGDRKMTINGALVSADVGLLIPGPVYPASNYNPDNIGLTLVYDARMQDFLSVARNPTKTQLSWKEGT